MSIGKTDMAVGAEELSPIEHELSKLNNAIYNLEKFQAEFEIRLRPILTPLTSAQGAGKETRDVPRPLLLRTQISEYTERVENIINDFNSLLKQLEI